MNRNIASRCILRRLSSLPKLEHVVNCVLQKSRFFYTTFYDDPPDQTNFYINSEHFDTRSAHYSAL